MNNGLLYFINHLYIIIYGGWIHWSKWSGEDARDSTPTGTGHGLCGQGAGPGRVFPLAVTPAVAGECRCRRSWQEPVALAVSRAIGDRDFKAWKWRSMSDGKSLSGDRKSLVAFCKSCEFFRISCSFWFFWVSYSFVLIPVFVDLHPILEDSSFHLHRAGSDWESAAHRTAGCEVRATR